MFENIMNFFKKLNKKDEKLVSNSRDTAKERLHLVLMQDRANVSADFLELMKQEIIEVIKKYIDVDENAIDVRLTNKENSDGTNGAPALYANIPILNIKNEARKVTKTTEEKETEVKGDKKINENKEDNIEQETNKKLDKEESDLIEKEEKLIDTNEIQKNQEDKVEQNKEEEKTKEKIKSEK